MAATVAKYDYSRSLREIFDVEKQLLPGVVLLPRLREWGIDYTDPGAMVWIFPNDLLPTVVEYYGVSVIHSDVTEPFLAHRLVDPRLKAGQELAREMAAEMGPVTEAELEELRKVWPPDD